MNRKDEQIISQTCFRALQYENSVIIYQGEIFEICVSLCTVADNL